MSHDTHAGWADRIRLIGVDFTSAPRHAKPITVASGHLDKGRLHLEALESCPDWASFEAVLARPGPWLGAFDFPFGLPRTAVEDLGWPLEWSALVTHCAAMGRERFRAALDAYRQSRPMGNRYPHRATDFAAQSHSPMKLVNPPVGLMFLEGAPRLLEAGVTIAGMHCADPARLAVEAYPGLLARRIVSTSYKSDDKRKQDAERSAARARILDALEQDRAGAGFMLDIPPVLRARALADHGGDLLDAVLALTQAAASLNAGPPCFGLHDGFDALEGWIAGASVLPT